MLRRSVGPTRGPLLFRAARASQAVAGRMTVTPGRTGRADWWTRSLRVLDSTSSGDAPRFTSRAAPRPSSAARGGA